MHGPRYVTDVGDWIRVLAPPRRLRPRGWLRVLLVCAFFLIRGPGFDSSTARADDPEAPSAAPALTLSTAIDELLTAEFLEEAKVGIDVVDLQTGRSLYSRGAELPLNPASNQKLVTTAAALLQLGPDHRYGTVLYSDEGTLRGPLIKGSVFLRGSGDPSLVTEDLMAIAAELRIRGIRRITGGVIVDATAFDRDEFPPGFDQKDEMASYRAPSGALSVNFNTFVIRAQPGAAVGSPAQAGIDPPVPSIELVNEATTAKGHAQKLFAEVVHDKGKVKVRLWGTIGLEATSGDYRYPVADPSRYAGEVMALALRRNGIKLGRSRIKHAEVPETAQALASHFSAPVSVLIRAVNKFSNNFMAEQILKTLALSEGPASFEAALRDVERTLGELGVPGETLRLTNGSGLYDTNRLTAKSLTTLLTAMVGDFRFSSDYLASLSIMGVDGTTRRRLDETPADGWVRVKTGTLDGISALSGIVGAPGRKPIVFSILFNDMKSWDKWRARKLQDAIVELLARHAAGLPLIEEVPAQGG